LQPSARDAYYRFQLEGTPAHVSSPGCRTGIQIEKQHVQHTLEERTWGAITAQQLSDWAAMLIMNTAYDWEGLDEQAIDELNELALL
jgi:hypothetical protein